MTILVVEDETDFSEILAYMLRRDGYDVVVAHDGETGLRLWREYQPELILLDLALPHTSGWELCTAIRRESDAPIVIISGSNGDNEIAMGLDRGADDFITKPFSPRIVQARIRAVLRRRERMLRAQENPIANGIHLDLTQRSVAAGDREVHLTSIEMQVLRCLMAQKGQVVSHRDVIESVWGYHDEAGSKLIKGHVLNLRKKLATIGSTATIQIIAGVGYLLSEPRMVTA